MLLGYCRVSTSEQAADGTTSLQEQERIIRGMAMARGFTAFDTQIYVDAGVSGSIHMQWRPAGRDLLEAAKPGDTVCAAKLDRMFRNSLDALKIYTKFKEQGIHLVLFDLGTEPITNDNGMSKVIFQVMSAFADHERETIRARMLDGKVAKKRNGGHAGGLAPYGYKIVGQGRHAKLEPAEYEQEILKRVEGWLSEKPDLNPYHLAKKLTENGVLTRNGKPFQFAQAQLLMRKAPQHAAH
jgi:DNA invertase Pin-like site-specific DNA recombinase